MKFCHFQALSGEAAFMGTFLKIATHDDNAFEHFISTNGNKL